MKHWIFSACTLISLGLSPAFSQNADIAVVMGDVVAIQEMSAQCPEVYPDVALMDQTEDQVWSFAVSTYGEARASAELSSLEMQAAINQAANIKIDGFIEAAGDISRVCEYLRSGAVRGFSQVSENEQEMSIDGGAVPQPQAPAPLPELDLAPLKPFY